MNMFDLHLHTYYSDGTDSPDSILAEVVRKKMKGFSITDHNRLVPTRTAVAEQAKKWGVSFVDGIEVSCEFPLATGGKYSIHILGYSFQFDEEIVRAGLERTIQGYRERGERIVTKCNAMGFQMDYDSLTTKSHELYLSRNTIAEEICRQRPMAFSDALDIAFIDEQADWFLAPEEAISIIHEAGGIAIWAHPGKLLVRGQEDLYKEILDGLIAENVDGIEVFHPSHPPEVTSLLSDCAIMQGMLITGGSDFHGRGRLPQVQIGSFGLISLESQGALMHRLEQCQACVAR